MAPKFAIFDVILYPQKQRFYTRRTGLKKVKKWRKIDQKWSFLSIFSNFLQNLSKKKFVKKMSNFRKIESLKNQLFWPLFSTLKPWFWSKNSENPKIVKNWQFFFSNFDKIVRGGSPPADPPCTLFAPLFSTLKHWFLVFFENSGGGPSPRNFRNFFFSKVSLSF